MDNMRAHYSHVVKDQLSDAGWEPFYNAPYSSPFHCIELVFSKVKRLYKQAMMRMAFGISDAQHKFIILEAIQAITREHVANTVARQKRLMTKYLNDEV